MHKLNSNKVALALGGLFALVHAAWAILVAIGVAKPFMDWILGLHFMQFQYDVTPFSLGTALLLVIVTGVVGYIVGYVFAWLWNSAHKN